MKDDTLPGGTENVLARLHPRHPDGRASIQRHVEQVFESLVRDYGPVEARRMWEAVAARRPKRRGRPPGRRNSVSWYSPQVAVAILQCLVDAPEYAGCSRWQLIQRTAELLDARREADLAAARAAGRRLPTEAERTRELMEWHSELEAARAQGPQAVMALRERRRGAAPAYPPSVAEWVAVQPRLSSEERRARAARIHTLHVQVERDMARLDAEREKWEALLATAEAEAALALSNPFMAGLDAHDIRPRLRRAIATFPVLPLRDPKRDGTKK